MAQHRRKAVQVFHTGWHLLGAGAVGRDASPPRLVPALASPAAPSFPSAASTSSSTSSTAAAAAACSHHPPSLLASLHRRGGEKTPGRPPSPTGLCPLPSPAPLPPPPRRWSLLLLLRLPILSSSASSLCGMTGSPPVFQVFSLPRLPTVSPLYYAPRQSTCSERSSTHHSHRGAMMRMRERSQERRAGKEFRSRWSP